MPPQPIDVVVCEMLHVALLVEKQLPVLAAFKENYLDALGPPLPRFVPEAVLQAVQPLQQSFEFHGYVARTVHYQDGAAEQRSVDWLMSYLIVPLASAIEVSPGDTVEVAFDYAFGGPLDSLQPTARLL